MDMAKLVAPSAILFLSEYIWPMENLGDAISWRPQPIVFAIAWSFLSVCVGVAWAYGSSSEGISEYSRSILYVLLIAALASFAPLVKYAGSRASPFVCAVSFALSLACLVSTRSPHNIAIAPLCGWLLLASLLSAKLD